MWLQAEKDQLQIDKKNKSIYNENLRNIISVVIITKIWFSWHESAVNVCAYGVL